MGTLDKYVIFVRIFRLLTAVECLYSSHGFILRGWGWGGLPLDPPDTPHPEILKFDTVTNCAIQGSQFKIFLHGTYTTTVAASIITPPPPPRENPV